MKTIWLLAFLTSFPVLISNVLFPGKSSEPAAVFEMLWATRMDFEKEIVNLNNGISYKDWYIYSGDIDFPPSLLAFNKNSGAKDWEIVIDEYTDDEIVKSFLHGDILVARTIRRVLAFDLEDRSLLWVHNLSDQGIRLGSSVIASNGKYYLEADFGFETGAQVQHLYEFDIHNGEYRVLASYPQDADGVKSISPPVLWEDELGTVLALFVYVPNALEPPEKLQQYLKAINVNTREEVWNIPVTSAFASNTLHAPIVYDDLIIVGGDWSLYAFHIPTGKQSWKHEFDYPWAIWTKTNHLLHNDRLYVNNSQQDVSCINPETGEVIWNSPKGGPNCTDNMIYYEKEDLLVFTSWGYGSVMILDALTGAVIHREHRYDDSQYNSDVVYDESQDLFFTSTFKHAVGFKVHRHN